MKWIVYALLAVNAAFFSWQFRELEPASPPVRASAPEPTYVNRLLLLSELDSGELRRRPPPVRPSVSSSAPEPDIAEAATERAAVGPDLLDVPFPEPVAPTDPYVCYRVGPLASAGEIESMRRWLEARGAKASLRTDERREIALYWVYFPPLPSREAAVQRVKRMRGEGIDDIYIIPRGDQANAVSLGVYSHRTSLERRVAELRSKGYSPSIVPRYRTSRASWFDAEFDGGFEFAPEEFAASFPVADMAPVPCESPPIARDPRVPYNSLGARERSAASPPPPGDGAVTMPVF